LFTALITHRQVRYEQATFVGPLMIAPGDDSVIYINRPLSPVDCCSHPASGYAYTARWSPGREAATRDPSTLADLLETVRDMSA